MNTKTKDTEAPQTADAHIWANEWLKAFDQSPDIATDKSTMTTWFANAIMAGYELGIKQGE